MDRNLEINRPVVLSLHGIRTRGKWQKDLTRALNEAGFVHESLDFGFFHALSLLNPKSRRARVDWFLEQYTAAIGGMNALPSIIAHSFGSYLVARTLQIYKQVRFDKIIICGSIVRREYPWSKILDRDQASEVLHDYGKLDVWARLVGWVVSDAGQSGLHGFNDDASGRVVQQCHPEFRHSDYFYKLNYKENWIPFLNGTHKAEEIDLSTAPPNWRFRAAIILAAVMIAIAASYAWINADKRNEPGASNEDGSAAEPSPPPSGEASVVTNGINTIPTQTFSISLKSDSLCSLRINGSSAGDLEPGISKVISVGSKNVRITCTSLEQPTIEDSREVTLSGDRVYEVVLLIKSKIEAHKEVAKLQVDENEREELARKKEIEDNLGFETVSSGNLHEVETGLLWMSRPQLIEGGWQSAARWCTEQGAMRLASSAELKRIVHPGKLNNSVSAISPLFSHDASVSKAWSITRRPNAYGLEAFTHFMIDLRTAEVIEVNETGQRPGYRTIEMGVAPILKALTFCVND